MSRALFNANPEIRRRLTSEFIPVAAGTETLQWPDTPVARWFSAMADRMIHQAGLEEFFAKYQTYQGLYVAGPDGTPYGMAMSWEAEEVTDLLDRGLRAHREHPPAKVELTEEEVRDGAAPQTDDQVSVIRMLYRCLPVPEGAAEVNRSVGRDHLWVFPDDVREIADAVDTVGEEAPLPRALVARLVRFQLLDNVRGMADPFAADEVSHADFRLALQAVEGARRRYTLRGDFAMEKDFEGDENYKGKLGVEGRLEGELEIDVEARRVLRVRAIAEGEAWGANSNTWGQPSGRFPLVIAMVEANDALTRSVPPVWTIYHGCEDASDPNGYLRPTLALWSK